MDEIDISRAIIEDFTKNFIDSLFLDVAIVGAGPSGLMCGYKLAQSGHKVAVFERHLRAGGGMPGGGMMFNSIVIQKEVLRIFDELGIAVRKFNDNLYVASSIETVSALCYRAMKSGVKIFNLMSVEDVVIRENVICGIVINWSSVMWSKLHVDPLSIKSNFVVDATGHDAEICRIVERKIGQKLQTPTQTVAGEKSMWAEKGENQIIENTKEVYPGLFVCGMAANAVFGSPRMGAVFGGMFLSGEKAAEMIDKKLKQGGKCD
ncbi:MAG TPA: sulfide-dependent adenosine diphosphate thiazole synthase [bacterium]|nr:sulfide-dependent adenosine diphosphate thiazole synthase [bacterium]HPP08083.1 sulfide-dependent adenosine diphosphate thiazole synthase [bacterium]